MNNELLITINEDGAAELYNPEWDLTIHCESEEDHNRCVEILQNAYKHEWIPCSERLPEVDKASEYYDAVNVTLDDGRVVNGCYRNRDEEWWVDAEDGEKYSINATGHVVAWMPLPEAYKE